MHRKNVFLIGAGASAHAGLPVMSEFLERAHNFLDRGLIRERSDSFDRVFRYQEMHDEAEARAGLDLTNLEEPLWSA